MRPLFIGVRIVGAIAIIAAIVAQLQRSLDVWANVYDIENPATQLVNFFSFFTIESNALTVVAFAVGAVLMIRNSPDSRAWGLFRVSVTAYMATTGVVYNLLLRGVELPQGSTVEWSNEILHVVGPLLVVIDWFFAPGRSRLEWKDIRVIVVFPIVWAVYTMIRGPLVQDDVLDKPFWYPYPFLNPNAAPEGYVTVAFYVVLIAVIIGLVGAGAIWVSRKGARWPLRSVESTVG